MRIEEVRWDNLTKLLELLLVRRRTPRKAIVKTLNIRNSTLTYLAGELNKHNMVKIEREVSGRGRPRHYISLNDNYGNFFGVKIGRESVKISIFTFSLKKIKEFTIALEYPFIKNLEKIRNVMIELVKKYKPLSMGIAISGTVDINNCSITTSPILGTNESNLEEIIKEHNCEVVLCNDVDALNVGQLVKTGRIEESSLTITFGIGIGASYYDSVDILLGSDGKSALEFGHSRVDYNGEKCYCGGTGCLETVASEYCLVKDRAKTINDFVRNFEHFKDRLNEIRESAKHNSIDKKYSEILDRLSYHVSSLSLLLRPDIIWIGGEGVVNEWIFLKIKKGINQYLSASYWKLNPEINQITLPDIWERGAAFLALRKYVRSVLKS
ncbi:MAG: ROK family protein [Thermotogota bacterium]|nr:ROK family protein [Thermotogota bacterium]